MSDSVPGSSPPFDGEVIEARGLGHVYPGGQVALDGIDLSFGTGVFGLLGPNGAGKSTFMRIVCTLLPPTAGEVRVSGHDVTTDRRAVRSLLGYLPQEFGAWRLHRTEEVLDTLARLSGLTDAPTRKRRVGEVLAMVGLEEVSHRKVKKLSGGMVRRLGVAQALVHEPRVLVVDEPTVGLDPEERIRFRQLVATLGQERTVLLSTHIVADLGAACREIALLDGGEIVYRGTPAGLLERAFGRVFEVTTDPARAEALEADYDIVSRSTIDGRVKLRGVAASSGLPESAVAVEAPTLEEGYLAFMAERGRSRAARQEEEIATGTRATGGGS